MPTMPRKRKSSISSEVTHIEVKPTSDHLELKVRRSTRRVTAYGGDKDAAKADTQQKDSGKTDTHTTRHIQGQGIGLLGPKESSGESSDSKEVEENEQMAREGVQSAIAGLAQMERRLVRATKRQKAKVEESDVSRVAPDRAEEAAFKPKLSTTASAALDSAVTQLRAIQPDDRGSSKSKGGDGAIEPADRGARPPPVNSDYLPLPWTGRMGYACLNTYLRNAEPPVFCSRTCRLSSIIDHQHPLLDPTKPEHSVKNRPDKTAKADKSLGFKFLQELGLANASDIVKMLRWNDKYGIRFMRLSSEMFPFASHQEHGYKLAPFAADVLREAGKVAAELGHRLTMHPGQFTQLGSPRNEVVEAAVRDLEYHDELLTLLQLPKQQDRDAVMIIHMGGVYGDKAAALDRFRRNYTSLLSPSIKARLVLENDDVSWSVHDLLPVCEELNIPLVLDFHHNNIVFDSTQIREGTFDISQPAIMERIAATWTRKSITQKMHYSEPCAGAVTPRDRRKHSPRVVTLPPCPPNMDLMIEAKDKEQAVFELMRTFKLPGFEKINDVIPYHREDQGWPKPLSEIAAQFSEKAGAKKRKQPGDRPDKERGVGAKEAAGTTPGVSAEDFGMGGPENRVYWPPGMEVWLKPRKRAVMKGVADDN